MNFLETHLIGCHVHHFRRHSDHLIEVSARIFILLVKFLFVVVFIKLCHLKMVSCDCKGGFLRFQPLLVILVQSLSVILIGRVQQEVASFSHLASVILNGRFAPKTLYYHHNSSLVRYGAH